MSFFDYPAFVADLRRVDGSLSPQSSGESPAAPETPPSSINMVNVAQWIADTTGTGAYGYDRYGLPWTVGLKLEHSINNYSPPHNTRVAPIPLEDDLWEPIYGEAVVSRSKRNGMRLTEAAYPGAVEEINKESCARGASTTSPHHSDKENIVPVSGPSTRKTSFLIQQDEFTLPDVGEIQDPNAWLRATFDALPDPGDHQDTNANPWGGFKLTHTLNSTSEDAVLPPLKKRKVSNGHASQPAAGPSTVSRSGSSSKPKVVKHKRAPRRPRGNVDALLIPDSPDFECPIEGCTKVLNASRRAQNSTHLETHYLERALHNSAKVKCLWCTEDDKLVPGNTLVDHVAQEHLHARYRCPYWNKDGVFCTEIFKKPGYTNGHMLRVHDAPNWSSEFVATLAGPAPQ